MNNFQELKKKLEELEKICVQILTEQQKFNNLIEQLLEGETEEESNEYDD